MYPCWQDVFKSVSCHDSDPACRFEPCCTLSCDRLGVSRLVSEVDIQWTVLNPVSCATMYHRTMYQIVQCNCQFLSMSDLDNDSIFFIALLWWDQFTLTPSLQCRHRYSPKIEHISTYNQIKQSQIKEKHIKKFINNK